jgi:NAD-dependent deacetylase sirtuin 5
VDGLSTRALEAVQSTLPVSESESSETSPSSSPPSQPQILEMHGRVFDVLCDSRKCSHCETITRSPICPALGGTEELVESGVIEPSIAKPDLPRCSKCGALGRPGVVWFGEQPHHLPVIHKLVDQADLCLVVGTSSTVSYDQMCNVEHAHRKMIGVPCSFLSAYGAEKRREGRCIQSRKESER